MAYALSLVAIAIFSSWRPCRRGESCVAPAPGCSRIRSATCSKPSRRKRPVSIPALNAISTMISCCWGPDSPALWGISSPPRRPAIPPSALKTGDGSANSARPRCARCATSPPGAATTWFRERRRRSPLYPASPRPACPDIPSRASRRRRARRARVQRRRPVPGLAEAGLSAMPSRASCRRRARRARVHRGRPVAGLAEAGYAAA